MPLELSSSISQSSMKSATCSSGSCRAIMFMAARANLDMAAKRETCEREGPSSRSPDFFNLDERILHIAYAVLAAQVNFYCTQFFKAPFVLCA